MRRGACGPGNRRGQAEPGAVFRLCTISNVSKQSSQDASCGDQGTSSAHSPSVAQVAGMRDSLQAVKDTNKGLGDAQVSRDPPHGSPSPLASPHPP